MNKPEPGAQRRLLGSSRSPRAALAGVLVVACAACGGVTEEDVADDFAEQWAADVGHFAAILQLSGTEDCVELDGCEACATPLDEGFGVSWTDSPCGGALTGRSRSTTWTSTSLELTGELTERAELSGRRLAQVVVTGPRVGEQIRRGDVVVDVLAGVLGRDVEFELVMTYPEFGGQRWITSSQGDGALQGIATSSGGYSCQLSGSRAAPTAVCF